MRATEQRKQKDQTGRKCVEGREEGGGGGRKALSGINVQH